MGLAISFDLKPQITQLLKSFTRLHNIGQNLESVKERQEEECFFLTHLYGQVSIKVN